MSLLMAGTVGVCRDLASPTERISLRGDDRSSTGVATFGHLVVAQIPGEALLAYTSLLALFSASTDGYRAGRWILYAVSMPVCAAVVLSSYLAGRAAVVGRVSGARELLRHLPWLPMTTAVSAMAIYGLTVPGSALQLTMSSTGFAITSGCLSVGGGIVMSIFAPFLGRGNARLDVPPAQLPTALRPVPSGV
ncbi:MAG TPA: hypothetical protein VE442_20565 [Jatrophihabitans sp.]|jgi:hypothetical protein|nr:hypothetical protein [Jatrophihabitans sp.]